MYDLTHASFFSGVGGLDRGLERAGWRTVSLSEIEPFPSAVLRSRFPDVPNLGDITKISASDIPDATLWSGGFPCQDLSVAGKRAGFAEGTRSSLAFTFLDLVEQHKPQWLLLENVPGLLSSNQGRDFGRLLGEVDELGYGMAWRVLDARYFGVAQRRRRVFIVGSLGSDLAGEILSEPEGSEGDFVPSLPKRAGHLASVALSVTATSGNDADTDMLGQRAFVNALDRQAGGADDNSAQAGHILVAPTLRVGGRASGAGDSYDNTPLAAVGPPPNPHGVRAPYGMAGRLDDTNPGGMDSARYKAIGNGVVSPVAEWIGRRIRMESNERRSFNLTREVQANTIQSQDKAVPYRCSICATEPGHYSGKLVFPGEEAPVCENHGKALKEKRLTPAQATMVPVSA